MYQLTYLPSYLLIHLYLCPQTGLHSQIPSYLPNLPTYQFFSIYSPTSPPISFPFFLTSFLLSSLSIYLAAARNEGGGHKQT